MKGRERSVCLAARLPLGSAAMVTPILMLGAGRMGGAMRLAGGAGNGAVMEVRLPRL